MNKVYKIVWNASLGAWVAVSELAKSKTKTKTVGSASLFAAMIVFAPSAFASYSAQGTGDNRATASGNYATAIGNSATASAQSSSAYGSGATATGFGSTALGNDAKATGDNSFAAGGGQNTGTGATASGNAAIAIGYLANAGGNTSIAIGRSATTVGTTRSVAIGDNASTASSGNGQSVAVGSVAVASGDQSVALGNNVNATGNSSIAIGGDDINQVKSAYNSNYKAITGVDLPSGYPETTAAGGGAVVVGVTAKATGNFSSAFGMAANAIGDASVALGTTANASGQGALAIGAVSNASKTGSVAIGINSNSTGLNSTAIGSGSSSSTGSQATGDNATAIGGGSIAAENGTALGKGANASNSATAIGLGATASQAGGVAIGSNSNASTASGVAGYDPITGQGSTNTTNVWKSTNAAVAVGSGSTVSRQITGVAAGTNDVDAVNVAQLKATKNYTDNVAKSTATALGGSSALDQTTGQVTTPRYTITKTDGTQTTVNGVENAFTTLNTEVVKPITFKGNSGSSSNQLGSTLTISGGSTADSSNSNVKTVVSGNTVDVQIANAPIFTGAVTAKGFDATGNTVANVKAGIADTDAVNVSQLTATNNNLTSKGFNITANGTNSDNVKLGETVNFTNTDGNLVASNSDNQVTYNLSKNITVDSVTSGNSSLTTDGLSTKDGSGNTAVYGAVRSTLTDGNGNKAIRDATGTRFTDGLSATSLDIQGLSISGGPSVTTTGINAADMKITKVAAGTADTDAVNVSQLTSTSNNLTSKGLNFTDNNGTITHKNLGETLTIKGTGNKTDDQYNTGNIKTTTDSNGNIVVGIDQNSNFQTVKATDSTTGNNSVVS
ncbi:hypothetical protein I2F27_12850, partial [Acinetobacter sp. B5B]|uniref:ESPR-type extended signal peptide-containing protein n=1 Tax=Acinetobacter baretiae TaxID=2605383 RepID=UPI0022A66BC0